VEHSDDDRRSQIAGWIILATRIAVKRLTLLRHAKSSWADDRLADQDRPLSKRGFADAPVMAERLVARGLKPELILSSPAERARQTAEFVASAFRPSSPAIRQDPAIYLATPGELLRVLAAVSDQINELVLVGHNPGMTELANLMLPDLALTNLPTAGAVAIDCDTDSWREIDAAGFSLRFYDYPKNPDI
jgi:phosphohistidine phosphatase